MKNIPHLYFFVRKKRINELLFDWTKEIKRVFGNVFFGAFRTLEDFLDFLFEYSNQKPFVVIFDEFQNFHYSNPTEFSLFQKVFDLKKENSKLLMIFSGSSYTLMEKIFKDIGSQKLLDLNRLNTIRNYFTHYNQEIFEASDKTKKWGKIIDPRDIEEEINFESLYSEFMQKAEGVEEYLFKLFQDLGGVAEKG